MNTTSHTSGALSPAQSPAHSDTQAADEDLLEVTLDLPQWLVSASEQMRADYVTLFNTYHRASSRLNDHLDNELPAFEDFTRSMLSDRIDADLHCEIDPDSLIIHLPQSVRRDYQLDPQYGKIISYQAPWIPGSVYERFTLSELAQRNFDPADEVMAQRLHFARIEYPPGQCTVQGLTGEYLQRVIPQLDVAAAWRKLIDTVLSVPAANASNSLNTRQILLVPYQCQIMLEGIAARSRGRISEAAFDLLASAALCNSRADSDAAGLEMNWVVFKPGHAVSGETASHTLRGVCAIRDRATSRTLIYLPEAPGGVTLIEGDSPDRARERLIQQMIQRPAFVGYLADRAYDAAHRERHISYMHQALSRHFEGFLRFVPSLFMQIANWQLDTRRWELEVYLQAHGNSQFDLARVRDLEHNQRLMMYFRALLGFVPGVGVLIGVSDSWADGHEAAKAFSEGRLEEGLLALGSLGLNTVDVVFSIVPGAATVRVLTRVLGGAARLKPVSKAIRAYAVQPFKGYEVDISLNDAVAQSGIDLGTVRKDGQLWIEHEGLAYPVYRRRGERTLRLRKSASHGYEPPVRLESGKWVYHTDVGLKGGFESEYAVGYLAFNVRQPGMTRAQARELLDQFRFPEEPQWFMETRFAIEYSRHRQIPQWAEPYRLGRVAAAQDLPPAAVGHAVEVAPVRQRVVSVDITQPLPGPAPDPYKELRKLIKQARPGWTKTSQLILAKKLAARSDPGVTDATLRAWRDGTPAPVSELDDPLSMLDGVRVESTQVAIPRVHFPFAPLVEPFNRLDVATTRPELIALFENVVATSGQVVVGKSSLRALMHEVISQTGYQLIPDPHDMLWRRSLIAFKRAGQARIYLLKAGRFSGYRYTSSGMPFPLSEAWLDEWLGLAPEHHVLLQVRQARAQGNLVKLLGGIVSSRAISSPDARLAILRLADDP